MRFYTTLMGFACISACIIALTFSQVIVSLGLFCIAVIFLATALFMPMLDDKVRVGDTVKCYKRGKNYGRLFPVESIGTNETVIRAKDGFRDLYTYPRSEDMLYQKFTISRTLKEDKNGHL